MGKRKPNMTTITLEPLSEAESREMISNLLDRLPLSPAIVLRITRAVDGNPLFAEELVAMLVDEELLRRDEEGWVARSDLSELPVPSTINALLAARLEGLPSLERAILTAAAVQGAIFHQSAVSELTRLTLDALEDGLLALVRRGLIRPEAPSFAGENAYRFRHALIRDAAYRSCRRTRAPTCTNASPLGSSSRPQTGYASSRKLSAIISNKPFNTVSRSVRATRLRRRLPPGRPNGSKQLGGGRLSAATSRRRSACLSGFPGSFPPRIQSESRCLLNSARR